MAPTTQPTIERLPVDAYAFLDDYSIQHYLESAVELRKLEPRQRAERLKKLAIDPRRASEVYVLCRMLFEAKPKEGFRQPMLGVAGFIDGGDSTDWPSEPITIFENIPILIVNGYSLGGQPELPESYVDYCLEDCTWRDAKYEPVAPEKCKQILEKFIAANPKMQNEADWFRRQAK